METGELKEMQVVILFESRLAFCSVSTMVKVLYSHPSFLNKQIKWHHFFRLIKPAATSSETLFPRFVFVCNPATSCCKARSRRKETLPWHAEVIFRSSSSAPLVRNVTRYLTANTLPCSLRRTVLHLRFNLFFSADCSSAPNLIFIKSHASSQPMTQDAQSHYRVWLQRLLIMRNDEI